VNPLLLPVVAVQGMWVRTRTEELPPAGGPTSGAVGEAAESPAPPVRIAVLGESTAAGCGVDSHGDGFAGALARELVERSRRPVVWEVVGRHGATARRIRHRLLPQVGTDLDIAVLLAGANDVLSRRTPEAWAEDLAAIVDGLAGRAEQVAVAGLPPFGAFPSLPATLGRYLAGRAAALDAASRQVCAGRPQVTWIGAADVLTPGPEFFARDGFHPSAVGYGHWARMVADGLAVRAV